MKDENTLDKASSLDRFTRSAAAFVQDYVERHQHPVNAALHLVGVPAVFYGLFQAVAGRSGRDRSVGLGLIVFGYYLQYLGHKKQGNEVGEISLIKFMVSKMRDAGRRRMANYRWFGQEDGDQSRRQPAHSASAGKSKTGSGNGNGDNGGNGHGSGPSTGRFIMWWKTSH